MENKYYTPEISEFHVGFEFEYEVDELDSDEPGWKKSILNFDFGWLEIPQDFALNKRVKYLDQSDIEEEGFVFVINKYIIPTYEKDCWRLYWFENNNMVTIEKFYKDGKEQYFRGWIKNKSELKKVLQMLNIK